MVYYSIAKCEQDQVRAECGTGSEAGCLSCEAPKPPASGPGLRSYLALSYAAIALPRALSEKRLQSSLSQKVSAVINYYGLSFIIHRPPHQNLNLLHNAFPAWQQTWPERCCTLAVLLILSMCALHLPLRTLKKVLWACGLLYLGYSALISGLWFVMSGKSRKPALLALILMRM